MIRAALRSSVASSRLRRTHPALATARCRPQTAPPTTTTTRAAAAACATTSPAATGASPGACSGTRKGACAPAPPHRGESAQAAMSTTSQTLASASPWLPPQMLRVWPCLQPSLSVGSYPYSAWLCTTDGRFGTTNAKC